MMHCRSGFVAAAFTRRVLQTRITATAPSCIPINRMLATTSSTSSYHIEVSNVARPGVTQIVITGPGVLGLLASMCCTLASMGGSIKTLHAVDSRAEDGMLHTPSSLNNHSDSKPIRDIITVVHYGTGKAFKDEELPALAEAVLQSTKAPLQVVDIVHKELEKRNLDDVNWKGRVTVMAGKDFTRL